MTGGWKTERLKKMNDLEIEIEILRKVNKEQQDRIRRLNTKTKIMKAAWKWKWDTEKMKELLGLSRKECSMMKEWFSKKNPEEFHYDLVCRPKAQNNGVRPTLLYSTEELDKIKK